MSAAESDIGVPRSKRSQFLYKFSCALIGASAILFFTLFLPAARAFPWSDEWDYLPAVGFKGLSLVRWLFQQHVDHRIPVQKGLHLWLLHLDKYDFRVLLVANYLFACATAWLGLRIAQLYRGELTIGDLAIPLVALNVGAGFAQWGFGFQFLSSTFFLLGFVALAVSSERQARPGELALALISLLFCALCGLNGLIAATLLTAILCALFAWELWRRMPRRPLLIYWLVAACALESVMLWVSWAPSGAARAGTLSVPTIVQFFYGMVTSSMVFCPPNQQWWKFVVMALLLVGGLVCGISAVCKEKLRSMSDIALTGAVAAIGLLIVVIAVGRSRYQPWVPGLEAHYGYSTLAAPIVAWILVSERLTHRWRVATGVALLVVFTYAYQSTWICRWKSVQATGAHIAAVQASIASTRNVKALVESNIADFYFVDDPSVRPKIESGIATLRRKGGYLYRPYSSNPPASIASSTPATVIGTSIQFNAGGNSEKYRVSGWSQTEKEWTWNEGKSAQLGLPIPSDPGALSLVIKMGALVSPPAVPYQMVEMFANGQKIADWEVASDTAEFSAQIPAEVTKKGGILNIEFRVPNATSPKALGLTDDSRMLGIRVHSVELKRG